MRKAAIQVPGQEKRFAGRVKVGETAMGGGWGLAHSIRAFTVWEGHLKGVVRAGWESPRKAKPRRISAQQA